MLKLKNKILYKKDLIRKLDINYDINNDIFLMFLIELKKL